jgi:hypothetical protein
MEERTIMNLIKLGFTQTLKAEHEIIVKTDLTEDELLDKLDNISFSDCWNVQNCAGLLEEKLEGEIEIKELTEGEPNIDDIECDIVKII